MYDLRPTIPVTRRGDHSTVPARSIRDPITPQLSVSSGCVVISKLGSTAGTDCEILGWISESGIVTDRTCVHRIPPVSIAVRVKVIQIRWQKVYCGIRDEVRRYRSIPSHASVFLTDAIVSSIPSPASGDILTRSRSVARTETPPPLLSNRRWRPNANSAP